jgi:hypothetical protein
LEKAVGQEKEEKGDVVEAMHFTSVLNCGKRITCHVKPD